jgi:hypothetical protein
MESRLSLKMLLLQPCHLVLQEQTQRLCMLKFLNHPEFGGLVLPLQQNCGI